MFVYMFTTKTCWIQNIAQQKAPGDILPCHKYHHIDDRLRDAGSTRLFPPIGTFLRDEFTIPVKQRVGCHKLPQFIKRPSAKHISPHGQSYSLFGSEAAPLFFQLLLKSSVIFTGINRVTKMFFT
jgi:hypothetical protein